MELHDFSILYVKMLVNKYLFSQEKNTNVLFFCTFKLNFQTNINQKREDVQVSISPTFYEQLLRQYSCSKKVQTYNVSTRELHVNISYEKVERKILVKLAAERGNRMASCDNKSKILSISSFHLFFCLALYFLSENSNYFFLTYEVS